MVPAARVLAILTLLLLLPGRAGADSPAPAAVSAAQRAVIDKYIEKGFPSPDRPWSAIEYQAFLSALDGIRADKSLPPPRKGDKDTGPLFLRLVSDENLDISRMAAIPIVTRLMAANNIMLKLGPVLFAYYDPQAEHQKSGAEVLEIMAYMLHSQDVVCGLADKFLDSLSAQEKANPARLEGLKQIKAGVAQSIGGSLTTLTEVSQYDKADLDAFAKRLTTLLPPLWPRIEESVRLEFGVRIKTLVETHTDDAIRQSMIELQGALKK